MLGVKDMIVLMKTIEISVVVVAARAARFLLRWRQAMGVSVKAAVPPFFVETSVLFAVVVYLVFGGYLRILPLVTCFWRKRVEMLSFLEGGYLLEKVL